MIGWLIFLQLALITHAESFGFDLPTIRKKLRTYVLPALANGRAWAPLSGADESVGEGWQIDGGDDQVAVEGSATRHYFTPRVDGGSVS